MTNPKIMTDRRSYGEVLPFKAMGPSQGSEPPALIVSWAALERQLNDLAATAKQRSLVASLISGTRKQAAFKPPEMVLREVLCIASVLMDESFHPDLEEGEMT
jgi:hypothetical protein